MLRSSRFTVTLLILLFTVSSTASLAFDSHGEKIRALQLISQIDDPGIRLELMQNVLIGNIDNYEQLESIVIAHLETTAEHDRLLKRELGLVLSDKYVSLGYTNARRAMFGDVDNVDGKVRCVYTGWWLKTDGIPNHQVMNTEHTWPQSYFDKKEPMRSDLHHLFPTKTRANSQRGRYPFGNVEGTPFYEDAGSKLGRDRYGNVVFEVRPDHKGDTARSMFYFSIRYKLSIGSDEEACLRSWHSQDPVSEYEQHRNDQIETYQKNRNIFVDQPDMVDEINNF